MRSRHLDLGIHFELDLGIHFEIQASTGGLGFSFKPQVDVQLAGLAALARVPGLVFTSMLALRLPLFLAFGFHSVQV